MVDFDEKLQSRGQFTPEGVFLRFPELRSRGVLAVQDEIIFGGVNVREIPITPLRDGWVDEITFVPKTMDDPSAVLWNHITEDAQAIGQWTRLDAMQCNTSLNIRPELVTQYKENASINWGQVQGHRIPWGMGFQVHDGYNYQFTPYYISLAHSLGARVNWSRLDDPDAFALMREELVQKEINGLTYTYPAGVGFAIPTKNAQGKGAEMLLGTGMSSRNFHGRHQLFYTDTFSTPDRTVIEILDLHNPTKNGQDKVIGDISRFRSGVYTACLLSMMGLPAFHQDESYMFRTERSERGWEFMTSFHSDPKEVFSCTFVDATV